MAPILDDRSKFEQLGPVMAHDRTLIREKQLVKHLKMLKDTKEISASECLRVKPIGSVRPRMYGVPKIHKQCCPLRSILFTTGSGEYRVYKWLCEMIQPGLDYHCIHNVKDSFEFVEILREKSIPASVHMCSFDVVSLFTTVPLSKTINIRAETLQVRTYLGRPVTLSSDGVSPSLSHYRQCPVVPHVHLHVPA